MLLQPYIMLNQFFGLEIHLSKVLACEEVVLPKFKRIMYPVPYLCQCNLKFAPSSYCRSITQS